MKNSIYNLTGAIVKRKGFQYKTSSTGGFGMAVYEDTDTTTGAVTETLVTIDDSLYTLVEDSFTITYSGSNTSLLNIGVDTSTNKYTLVITEDETEVFSSTLGLGLDESSTTLLSAVISAIDALSDYAASGGNDTTNSAAFIDLFNDSQLTSTATTINYYTYSQANESSSNPLATTLASKNDNDFENASFVNLNNILYISTGYDEMHKYDGQTLYRAGMPAGGDADGSGDAGVAPSIADTGSGSTFASGDDYFYKYSYIQYDNKNNVVEGILSPGSSKHTVAAANTDIDVTVTNISSSSGFNTNCAIVNGAQNGVTTITVDSGHTLNSGDTAYFYDGNTSTYVTKTLTSTTSTSITFSGAVDVADNAVISNNLRIAIYRTDEIGTATDADAQTYKLVAEIPNDSIGTSTQVYVDQVTDANLGATYITPIKPHGLPPKGRYSTVFRNQLFIAGDPENVNTVYYSDVDSPEFFPAGDNSFLVDTFEGSKVRGLGSLDTALVVFKDRSVQSVTGDIADDSFRVDELSFGGIGCSAHASIQKIAGNLFFLSDSGVYAVNLEGVSTIGNRIKPQFTAFDVTFNFQKATSVNWIDQSKYVLFMPDESQDGSSNDYADADSRCYVYDYERNSWHKWTNVNAQGGFGYRNSRLFFSARRLDSDSSAVEFPTAIFNNYGDKRDYSDHQEAVDFEYKTSWHSLGEPNLFKKFLRLKTFALSSDILDGSASLNTLTVDTEFNFTTPAVVSTFTQDFSNGATGWGSAWGTSPWGDSPLIEIKSKLKVVKARSMRLTFRNNTALEDVLISGYELEVAPAFIRAIKE
jgi:hypothetical protein